MTARLPFTPTSRRPPASLDRGPARPPVPSLRQLWLDCADPASDGGQRRLAARIDWGRLHAAFWVVALAVITALALTGGIR